MRCVCGTELASRDEAVDHVVDVHDGFDVIMDVYVEDADDE